MIIQSIINRLNPCTVGIDLGSEYVKMIALRGEKSAHEVLACGVFKKEDRSGILTALNHPRLARAKIRINIDNNSLRLGKIDIPKVPDNERQEVIKWALKTTLKKPLDQFEYRTTSLSAIKSGDQSKESLFYFAAAKEEVSKSLSWLYSQRGRLEMAEPGVNAMAYCVVYNYAPKNDEIIGVLDIGRAFASFFALTNQGILFFLPIPKISLNALVSGLSQERQLSPEDAEAQLAKCLDSDEVGQDEITRSFLSILCIKLQEAIDEFEGQFKGCRITSLFVAGGGSFLTKIDRHLEEIFNVKTSLINPIKNIKVPHKQMFKSEPRIFSLAIGLAL